MIAQIAMLAVMTASQFSGGTGPYQGPSPYGQTRKPNVEMPPHIPAMAKLHHKFDGVVLEIKLVNQSKEPKAVQFQVTPDDPSLKKPPVWRTYRYKLAPNERLEAVRLVTTRARRWKEEIPEAIYRPHHPTAIWVRYNGSKPVKMQITEFRVPRSPLRSKHIRMRRRLILTRR